MRSQQHHADRHPAGRVDGPGLLYGSIGLALALAMQMAGLFKQGDARLQEKLLAGVFGGVAPEILTTPVLLLFAAVFSFGMAFAVLDSAGAGRRLVLGITALMVVLAMVPTFAVWHIYFSPFLPLIALFWSWFCAMMYANHHIMPCEVSVAAPGKRVAGAAGPGEAGLPETAAQQRPAGSAKPGGLVHAQDNKEQDQDDPYAKYQPREKNDGKEQ